MLSWIRAVNIVFKIVFYRKENGESPVLDYLRSLKKDRTKDGRIKLNKFFQYTKVLSECGTQVGEPVVKHLKDEIWELRPSGNRVLFAGVIGNRFVLLHVFQKQTQKTPSREIERAKQELNDFLERNEKS